MIGFFIGLACGAGVAVAAYVLFHLFWHENTSMDETAENKAEIERLNREKNERAKLLRELDRQFDNMMKYTGKEQKQA